MSNTLSITLVTGSCLANHKLAYELSTLSIFLWVPNVKSINTVTENTICSLLVWYPLLSSILLPTLYIVSEDSASNVNTLPVRTLMNTHGTVD